MNESESPDFAFNVGLGVGLFGGFLFGILFWEITLHFIQH